MTKLLLLLLISYTTAAVSLSVAKHQPELVQYSVCQAVERLLDQLQADVVISVLSAAAQVYMESAAYTMFSLMTCRYQHLQTPYSYAFNPLKLNSDVVNIIITITLKL